MFNILDSLKPFLGQGYFVLSHLKNYFQMNKENENMTKFQRFYFHK